MSTPMFIVDAFADGPFRGNPAAVCLPATPLDPERMQQVAAEMNLSETAYVTPNPDGWDLRWFTPKVEVALCGHATLASAHVLWETGRLAAGKPARFLTRSGWLTATRDPAGITLDFPAKAVESAPMPEGLAGALGASPVWVGKSAFDYLIELADAATVRALKPDFTRLAALPVRGIIVTARADAPDYDIISRFFAPAAGVNEDPVTGSAHCSLGPFWRERLGKDRLRAHQASARGGSLSVEVRGDRVLLGGTAVTMLRGELVA